MAGTINQAASNSLVQASPKGAANDGTGMCQIMLHRYGSANFQKGILSLDPWLEPFQDALKSRFSKAQKWIDTIKKDEGGFDKFTKVL